MAMGVFGEGGTTKTHLPDCVESILLSSARSQKTDLESGKGANENGRRSGVGNLSVAVQLGSPAPQTVAQVLKHLGVDVHIVRWARRSQARNEEEAWRCGRSSGRKTKDVREK